VSRNLAAKLIGELGCTDGRKVLEIISQSVEQRSNGKFRINMDKMEPMS
jgi:hypothetical protein